MVSPKILTCTVLFFLIVTATFAVFPNQPKELQQKLQPIETTVSKIIIKQKLPDPEEVFCLAQNIYHEARGEDLSGQVAVAHVTMNRVSSRKFPNTVCEVVYQARYSKWWMERGKKVPIRHKCQFSWYCDGKSDGIGDWDSFDNIAIVSREIILGIHEDNTNGAVYYHADYVKPNWSNAMTVSAVYDNHIFYSD
jgi:spore germination cell wall hydrolase CwlJ-like protein